MNAMTWFDHETNSIWSQPWGMAISGPLKGTRLDVFPFSLTPWASWRAEHPDTLALDTSLGRYGGDRERPRDGFVVGVELEKHTKAYPYWVAAREQVINDSVGPHPVVVYADRESRNVHVYLRNTGEQVLTFTIVNDLLMDEETGTLWDTATGLAREGPLKGTLLKQVPYTSAFDWAWLDFYSDSSIYGA